MIIALDFGNTSHKVGVFDGDELVWMDRFDRLTLSTLRGVLERFPQVGAGIASAVVRYPAGVKRALQHHFGYFIELDPGTPVPLANHYKTPATLGRDRIACAVAACRLFPGVPVLVINAGTCITFDFVNRKSEYLGGAISPGLQMRLKAMHTFTRKLPLLELQEPEMLIGQDTRGSMLSGALYGSAAEITAIVEEYRKTWPDLQVILSGGDMGYLDKLLKIRIFALPHIVMVGLKYILEYNQQHAK